MVDSENSRSLPTVTRRSSCSTIVAWLKAQSENESSVCSANLSEAPDDPVLSKWREWMTAHTEVERLCRTQQRLEGRLIAAVRYPRVEVLGPGGEQSVTAFTASEIDSFLGCGADTVNERAKAKATLRSQQQAWEVMDKRLGYSLARRAEVEAEARSEKLAEALWTEPARSIAGIAAKLHALLMIYDDEASLDEPPWQQIRSVLMDLTTLNSISANA